MMHSLQLNSPRPALNLRRRPILNKSGLGRVIAAWLVLMAADADAAPAFAISMSAPRWDAPSGTGFERREGFPDGLMTLQSGIAVLENTEFSNGAIEFDMKALAFADTGIQFRRKDRDSSEFVYLRADPDCPAANDCIQYAPITHGLMQWDIYSRYQGSAPISEKGWNHVRIVAAGKRMRVFVNRQPAPSLDVERLQGLSESGGIAFKGPAIFANLLLNPDDIRGLEDDPKRSSGSRDPRIVTEWLVSPPTPAPTTRSPMSSDIPASHTWKRFVTESDGLANMSREFGPTPTPALVWLKAHVRSNDARAKNVQLGWTRQIWVFVNGSMVYAKDNPYYPEEKRLGPDGRLQIDNATIALPMRKGENEIVVALGNTWQTYQGAVKPSPYGWGMVMAFADLSDIQLIAPLAGDGR